MLSKASKSMHIVVWVLALMLTGAVAACPLMACPMVGPAPSAGGDDCCPKSTHSSSHCPRQTPSDCPYLVVEKSLLSKAAQAGPVIAACTVTVNEPTILPLLAPHRLLTRDVSADMSDTYLQIRVLRI